MKPFTNNAIKKIMLLSLSAVTFASVVTSTVAWLKRGYEVSIGNTGNVNINAGAEAAYYGGGDGSKNDPYIISNPNHLYNLAWLQYIGMYNVDDITKTSPATDIQEMYFKVTATIDMSGIVLPPIGTETYPFFSHFDGNNQVIENLIVSNDDPTQSTSDFGVTKPSVIPNHCVANLTRVEGFFGVVGAIPTNNVLQEEDYEGIVPDIKNITLNTITVQTGTHTAPNAVLIGLAAGYVDGVMSGVKISGTSTLTVDGETAVDTEHITNKLSDYGLVGYATDDYVSYGGNYQQKFGEYYDSELETQGKDTEWGGSVNMRSAFNRLSTIRSRVNNPSNLSFHTTAKFVDRNDDGDYNDTNETTITNNSTNGTLSMRRYSSNTGDNYLGNFTFLNNTDNKIYMGGGTYQTDEYFNTSTGYYLTDGTHRLGYNLNGTTVTLTDSTNNNPGNRYLWDLETTNGTGYVRCYDETNRRWIYLRHPDTNGYSNRMGTLDTATSESTRTDWSINITSGTLYLEHGNYRVEYRTGTDYGWKLYDKTYVQDTPAHSSLYSGTTTRYYLPSSLITQANKTITGTASNTPGVQTEEIYFDAFTNTNGGEVSCYLPSSPTTKYYLYARHTGNSYNSGYTITLAQTSPGNDYHLMYSYTTGNNNTRYIRTSETIATRNNGNTYYCFLRYDNGWRAYYNTGTNNYALNIATVAAEQYDYSEHALTIDANSPYAAADVYDHTGTGTPRFVYRSTDTTYFPLNVDDDEGTAENPRTPTYEPTDKNTGYYVCGFTNQSATVDTNRDITLTYYGSTNATHTAEGGKIVESFGSTTTPYNQATLHDIQTIKSNNGALSVEPIEGHESEYTRYASASKSLQKVLRSDSNVYGMHFVNKAHTGDISKNAVVRATNVSLLGQTYPYYDLPVHSIDFNLEKQGYITFLSGVYSGSNKADTGVDSFFSLHQVVRAQGDVTTITDVKRISQIYVNTDTSENAPPYVYKYSDSNSYSTGTPGDLIFDTATIGDVDSKISDWKDYTSHIFYFEIPVNPGEYCLGNVPGADESCYMLYLDIGANGKENEDKIYSYSITSVNDMQAYPLGVDFAISAATGDGGDSIAVFIIPTSDGSVTFTPSGNSIAVGGTTTTVQELDEEDQPVTKTYSISHYSYHNLGCSVTAATGGAPPQPVNTEPIYSRTTYITVLSFNDNTKAYDIYYYFKVVDENISSTGALIANTTETTYYIGTKLQSGEIEYEEALWESEGEEVGITEIVTSLAAEGFLDELRTRDIVAIIAKLTGKTIFDSTLPDMPWAVGTTTNPYDPEDDTWLDEDSIQYVITVSSSGTITIQVTVTTVTSGNEEVIAYTVVVNGNTIDETPSDPITVSPQTGTNGNG